MWPKVLSLNSTERRIGVFVTINETDFGGRRVENIVRARGLFVDADGADRTRSCRDVIRATGAGTDHGGANVSGPRTLLLVLR